MKSGKDLFTDVLNKSIAEGKNLTPHQLEEMELLAERYDELQKLLLQNLANMGNPIWAGEIGVTYEHGDTTPVGIAVVTDVDTNNKVITMEHYNGYGSD